MGISASDVVPFTQASADLSRLAATEAFLLAANAGFAFDAPLA
jgi:hypothetical protein